MLLKMSLTAQVLLMVPTMFPASFPFNLSTIEELIPEYGSGDYSEYDESDYFNLKKDVLK